MSKAAKLIDEVHAAGGEVTLLDGKLKLNAAQPLPENLVSALREHKREIITELGCCVEVAKECANTPPRNIPWTSTDWHAHYHERVGIRMDGALSEKEAKSGAQEDMIQEWLFQNPPEPNDGNVCGHCNKALGTSGALPYLAGRNGHIWLHQACWPDWFGGRKQSAAEAIKVLVS